MGLLTSRHPKCMTELLEGETILSRQLKLLQQQGIREIVITTGLFDQVLVDYCHSLELDLSYTFVNNPVYDKTNYIYSIELAKNALDDELVLMHGDLVFSGHHNHFLFIKFKPNDTAPGFFCMKSTSFRN